MINAVTYLSRKLATQMFYNINVVCSFKALKKLFTPWTYCNNISVPPNLIFIIKLGCFSAYEDIHSSMLKSLLFVTDPPDRLATDSLPTPGLTCKQYTVQKSLAGNKLSLTYLSRTLATQMFYNINVVCSYKALKIFYHTY